MVELPCKLGRVSKSSGNQHSSFSRTKCTMNFYVSGLLFYSPVSFISLLVVVVVVVVVDAFFFSAIT